MTSPPVVRERRRPCSISLDHFPSTYIPRGRLGGLGGEGGRVLSTSSRDSLPRDALPRRHCHQAGRISSRIVPEPSLPPQPLSRPPSRRSPFSVPSQPSTPPSCHRCRLARATAPSPPCRIQMSLFSGPLRSPFTQPCAVTRRGRGREKDYVDVGEGEKTGEAGSIRVPSTDTLARMSAPPPPRRCFRSCPARRTTTVHDKIA